MDIEELKDTISIQEAAARLHRSKKTVYRWVESGKLPALKVGMKYFIKIADIEVLASGQIAYSDTIVQKIDEMETHLHALEYRFGNLERRMDAMEAQKTPTIAPEPEPTRPAQVSPPVLPRYEKAARTYQRLQDGSAVFTKFYEAHGISTGAAGRARINGRVKATKANGHDERGHTVGWILTLEQQEQFCRHFKDRLVKCSVDDCVCHLIAAT